MQYDDMWGIRVYDDNNTYYLKKMCRISQMRVGGAVPECADMPLHPDPSQNNLVWTTGDSLGFLYANLDVSRLAADGDAYLNARVFAFNVGDEYFPVGPFVSLQLPLIYINSIRIKYEPDDFCAPGTSEYLQ